MVAGLSLFVDNTPVLCRFPVVLSPAEIAEEASEYHPLLALTVISQPGLARGQTYYPLISCQISKTLQVSPAYSTVPGTLQVQLHETACLQSATVLTFNKQQAHMSPFRQHCRQRTKLMPKSTPQVHVFRVLAMNSFSGKLVCGMQISLSETLVWRAAEMVQRLDLASLSPPADESHTEAATDVPMQMSLVSISNLAGKVRYTMAGPLCDWKS